MQLRQDVLLLGIGYRETFSTKKFREGIFYLCCRRRGCCTQCRENFAAVLSCSVDGSLRRRRHVRHPRTRKHRIEPGHDDDNAEYDAEHHDLHMMVRLGMIQEILPEWRRDGSCLCHMTLLYDRNEETT